MTIELGNEKISTLFVKLGLICQITIILAIFVAYTSCDGNEDQIQAFYLGLVYIKSCDVNRINRTNGVHAYI